MHNISDFLPIILEWLVPGNKNKSVKYQTTKQPAKILLQ
jgi:hypothetical protein